VIGAFRNFELNQMDIINKPGRAFFVEEEGVPAYDELVLVANRADLAKPALRRFVDAIERATQYMVNHPEEAWKHFIASDKKLDDELNRRAWRDTLPRFALRPGALDRARYHRFATWLTERGMVKKTPPLDTYAVELAP
jgi:putative hydroxymethylpyrimidine transport system substrate-binding protein